MKVPGSLNDCMERNAHSTLDCDTSKKGKTPRYRDCFYTVNQPWTVHPFALFFHPWQATLTDTSWLTFPFSCPQTFLPCPRQSQLHIQRALQRSHPSALSTKFIFLVFNLPFTMIPILKRKDGSMIQVKMKETFLNQGYAHFSVKVQISKHFRLHKPYSLCPNEPTLSSWHKSSHWQCVNKWAWLCSNRLWFTKTGSRPDLAHGP